MHFFQNFIANLPMYLLSLPVVLLALSFHEFCHGYVAYKLGYPTARNMGRLTLNPLKHLNIMGFLCLVFFHFGWANPVPVNSRYFKKPRRDMALVALAGPLSNLLQAVVCAGLLRLTIPLAGLAFGGDVKVAILQALSAGTALGGGQILLCLLSYLLYLGVVINLGYMVFNLIPIPPLDGSRILFIFLPTKIYFGLMKYERFIMIAFLIIAFSGLINVPLQFFINLDMNGLFLLFGMGSGTDTYQSLYWLIQYVTTALGG